MKFLVVGLGSMGKRRVRCLQRLGYSDIVGYDPRADRCAETGERYNIATLTEWPLAAARRCDAWIISTPPDTHCAYALQAIDRETAFFTEAGVDDPLMPLVIERLEATGIVGAPSCTMRYYAGPRKIKSAINDQTIGKPLAFTYHSGQYLPDWHPWENYQDFYVSKRKTGACREIVPFELSWLIDVFGSVRELRCLRAKLSDLETDIDDIYQLLLHFDGLAGQMMVDVIARPAVRTLHLLGSRGSLTWNHAADTVDIWTSRTGAYESALLRSGVAQPGYIHSEEPYIAETADFVAAVRHERTWPYSYRDDERTLSLLTAAEFDSQAACAL